MIEEKEQEELLWAQLSTHLLIPPDDLFGLFLILEHCHRYQHCPLDELLQLQVIHNLLLVNRLPRSLLYQYYLKKDTE